MTWRYGKGMNAGLGMMFGWHDVMGREWMQGWGDVWMTWRYGKGMNAGLGWCLDDMTLWEGNECRVGGDVWMTWGYVKGMMIAGLGVMFGWHDVMGRAWMQGWGWCLDDMTLWEGNECRVGVMFGWHEVMLREWWLQGWGWCLDDMRLC